MARLWRAWNSSIYIYIERDIFTRVRWTAQLNHFFGEAWESGKDPVLSRRRISAKALHFTIRRKAISWRWVWKLIHPLRCAALTNQLTAHPPHTGALTAVCTINATWRSSLYINKKCKIPKDLKSIEINQKSINKRSIYIYIYIYVYIYSVYYIEEYRKHI